MAGGWTVERWRGSAGEFHARALPDPMHRAVWVLEVDRPALVLGSSQRTEVVDGDAAAAAGIEVVRRRSGGGAVLLVPGEVCWVDVLLPAGDTLWKDDVGRAGWWLGEAWQAALAVVGGPQRLGQGNADERSPRRHDPLVAGRTTTVHRGPMVHTPWSSLVCFAGVGPGEVLAADGSKIVGVSQRRTRAGARFQCALYRRWDPRALAGLLALQPAERGALSVDLAGAVSTVDVPADALVDALVDALAGALPA